MKQGRMQNDKEIPKSKEKKIKEEALPTRKVFIRETLCESGRCIDALKKRRRVLTNVPPERKPERRYIRMFPRNENRNKGTFGCSPGTKTGTRVRSHVPPERKPERGLHSPKPPFCETALLCLPVKIDCEKQKRES